MPSPGRNDPCPCGSGRKFKQCCGNATALLDRPPTRADRDAGYDLVDRLSDLPRFDEDVDLAFALVWRDLPDTDVDRLMDTPAGDLVLEWLWFDYLLHTGQTLAEYALDRHPADVGPGARHFLRACAAAPLQLLQVHRVEHLARVHVRDVIDKQPAIVVSERLGTEQLVRHDVLLARIAHYGDDAQFEGMNLLFDVDEKLAIAKEVRRLRRLTARDLPAGAARDRTTRMVSGAAMVISAIDRFDRPPPRVTTVDGDEMALADALFSVTNLDAARAALDGAADLAPDQGRPESADDVARYTWLERPRKDDDDPIRILGSVVLERTSLRVETMSMVRARLAQSHFAAIVPDTAMRFKAIQVRSMQAALEEARARPQMPEPEIAPQVLAGFQREFYEKHYREWLDIPLPALGHRTPREAAGVKKLRTRLVALVEGIEVQAARDAQEGRGFDVGFLRLELGLPNA